MKTILYLLPYFLAVAFSLTAGFIWIDSIIKNKYSNCFNINVYGEAIPEAFIFMGIGILGTFYIMTEAREG